MTLSCTGIGFKFQGIRHITPEQAERLRTRISRDMDYYRRLSNRLALWHVRDDATHAVICGVLQVERRLGVLRWAALVAGTGCTDEDQPYRDSDWVGDGI